MIINRVTSKANSASAFRFHLLAFSLIAFIMSGLLFHKEAFCGQVTLAWDPDTTSGLAGYKVHYGTVSKNYSFSVDAGNHTTATITGLTAGATYYFAATAYDTTGNESAPSNQVTYTVPASCSYAVAPTSVSAAAPGGTGSVTVATAGTCSWTTSDPVSWVTITSGASGTGNGIVNYAVTANTSASSRTVGLTIAGAAFAVTQAAATITTYTITAGAGYGGSLTPSGSVSVNGGVDRTFRITPDSGYTIQNVVVDGFSVGQGSSYTFSNVSANHTIQATFKQVKLPPGLAKKKK